MSRIGGAKALDIKGPERNGIDIKYDVQNKNNVCTHENSFLMIKW
jgi:hypothetical protein